MIVYVSIGNSDDSLTQHRWADFITDLHGVLEATGRIHGEWVACSCAPYQNACVCLEMTDNADVARVVRSKIANLAYDYEQESIAWAIVDHTDFIGAAARPQHDEKCCMNGVPASGPHPDCPGCTGALKAESNTPNTVIHSKDIDGRS